MLRFLNPDHIVELLREGQVPPTVQLTLVSLIIALQCLLGHPGLIGPLASSATLPFSAFQLCMALVTFWLGFKANGGAIGKDFLTRYITLACVLFLWVHGVAYILYYGVYLVLFASLGHSTIELFRLHGPAQLIFVAVTALAFMLSIQHYITKVAVGSTT